MSTVIQWHLDRFAVLLRKYKSVNVLKELIKHSVNMYDVVEVVSVYIEYRNRTHVEIPAMTSLTCV